MFEEWIVLQKKIVPSIDDEALLNDDIIIVSERNASYILDFLIIKFDSAVKSRRLKACLI